MEKGMPRACARGFFAEMTNEKTFTNKLIDKWKRCDKMRVCY